MGFRSGETIFTSLFRNLDRELAGRFFVLLSMPAILGAAVFEFRTIGSRAGIGMSAAGMVVAFCNGLICLQALMEIIKKGKLENFPSYRWGGP